jgi:hypothetical protein
VVTVGLWAPLEAKAGKEQELAEFLEGGRALVDQEPETTAWFAPSASDLPHSQSSISSPTIPAARLICRAASPRRCWRGRTSCSHDLRKSRRST